MSKMNGAGGRIRRCAWFGRRNTERQRMRDFDFDDIDDFDEFESVDLSGPSNRSSGRSNTGFNSAATSGGAASRMSGNLNGEDPRYTSAARDMHSYINDPTFDPTIDDEFDDFPEDFDMHGDMVYEDRTDTDTWSRDTGYSRTAADEDFSDDFDDFEEDFDMHGDTDYDEPQEPDHLRITSHAGKSRAGLGHGSGKSRNSDKKNTGRFSSLTRRIIAFAIAEVLVLTGIFSYAFIKRQYNKIQRPDIDIDAVTNPNLSIEDIQKMDEGFWTVAIFGLDSRDNGVGKGNNSDVIIIASIDRQTGEIKLVSVFRDTYLSTGDGKYNKINAAYCNGGPEQAIKALNENLDLNITQYVSFNWKAVATAINLLGGVDVELSKAEFYYINSFITETVKGTGIGSYQLKQAGLNHLDGVQAVAYASLRSMDNDYARTERQRKIISLCFDKVKQTDPATLLNMAGVMLEMVGTNMGWQEASEAVGMLSKLNMGDTGGFPYARGEAVIGKHGSCVIPQTLESNVIELHRQLFHEEDYQCSEKVKSIGAKISAESGMYTEGKFIGHVSTAGYIPETKAASSESSIAQTSAAETTASETVESQSSLPDIEDMSDEELQEAIEEYLKDLGITADDREYSVSTDGYIIYVSGQDADGNPTYKYVLGNDGKRIKITESSKETTAAESTSTSSTSAAETTSARATAPSPGSTTAATGPGASGSTSETTSAVETRAADVTGTIEAQTTEAVKTGTTTSHSTTTEASPTPRTTAAPTSAVTPGSSTTTTSTTAAYPGSSTTSGSGTGPGGTSTSTVTPGSTTAASTTAVVAPGSSTTTTTAASASGSGSTTGDIVPAAP